MTVGNDTLYFTYGVLGPNSVTWNGTTYYYSLNLQGDVIGIFDDDGKCLVSYNWDNAWGYNPVPEGRLASTLGTLNPLRYRSYVYDTETGLYYLQSRYYNPEIGRFINADSIVAGVDGSLLGYNLFTYCFNNAVNMSDASGNWPEWLVTVIDLGASTSDISTSCGFVVTTGSSITARGPTLSKNSSFGVVSSKAHYTLGYVTGSFRGQATQSGSKHSKSVIGGFGKASVINIDLQNRIGTQHVGIAKKYVVDIGTVTAQAGIQYADGVGVSLGAKASVVTARGTYCIDIFGWKIEVGMSVSFLSYGYEFAYGALPEGGWGIRKGESTGLFGYTYQVRITPP